MNKNNATVSALTAKQIAVLTAVFEAAEKTPENHVDRKGVKFSPDVFNRLKKDELVGSHGKFVWVTKKGAKALESAPTPEAPVEEPKAPAPKAPRAKKASGPTLDWAYRRLRRQALLFFGNGMEDEARKELREHLESLPHSYKALRGAFKDSEFDSFLEWFFGHEIHPGSRK